MNSDYNGLLIFNPEIKYRIVLAYREINYFSIFSDVKFNSLENIYKNAIESD